MKKKETIIIPSTNNGVVTVKVYADEDHINDFTKPCNWSICPTIKYSNDSHLTYQLPCGQCPAYELKQKMTFFEICAWWRRQYINLITLDYSEGEDGSYE